MRPNTRTFCRIEKEILRKKNGRIRIAYRTRRLGGMMTIAVVYFLLTTYVCTTHTHWRSRWKRETEMRQIYFYSRCRASKLLILLYLDSLLMHTHQMSLTDKMRAQHRHRISNMWQFSYIKRGGDEEQKKNKYFVTILIFSTSCEIKTFFSNR